MILCVVIGFTIFVTLQDNQPAKDELGARRKVAPNRHAGARNADGADVGETEVDEKPSNQVNEPVAEQGLDQWDIELRKAKNEAKQHLENEAAKNDDRKRDKVTQTFKAGELGNYEVDEKVSRYNYQIIMK